MSTLEQVRQRREEILRVAARHGATNARIFGSVVRGDDEPESDVDFLIDVGPRVSAWFPVHLIEDLEALIGRRVDIVTSRGLSPILRDKVLGEAKPL